MNNNIAIIIPAYRAQFFNQTLDSLASQTDKRFNAYIGDDDSPEDLYKIVEKYETRLNIRYKKFDKNLGGRDLVAQWNRCLSMMQDEEWFIMFSDDDIMESTCIEKLKLAIQISDYDVYHFDIKIIDENNVVFEEPALFPQIISSELFFQKLYTYQLNVRMPEFIFRKSHFLKTGGFVEFPLAMRTDNATVIQCAIQKGIYTIQDSFVYWRYSGSNTSGARQSEEKTLLKFGSLIAFFNWTGTFFAGKGKANPMSPTEIIFYLFKECLINSKAVHFKFWRFPLLKCHTVARNRKLIPFVFFKVILSKLQRKDENRC
jgi:GT2 family glycosyltransferase